ncbi:MAG: sulfurtransferase-like selenium metabolism protein YedF [Firmicutes bacterium]|nr:sulfurtransferase-like selenium metabolism protein YedF [Bacillota bacterium]
MKTKNLDMLGQPCPRPMIEAKKLLAEAETRKVIVKADNMPCVQNLEKMAKASGFNFSFEEKSKTLFEIVISKSGELRMKSEDNESLTTFSLSTLHTSLLKPYGIAISSDKMGRGEDELGRVLIKGFIYSLTELETPPKFIAFFNSGVFLTNEKSNTIDDLRKLEEKGTEILSCGTCLNYNKLEKPSVGLVANMFEIVEHLTSGVNIVNI